MSKIDIIYDLVSKNSEKLDSIDDNLAKIEGNVGKNTEDLKEHIRRTEANEKRLEHIENKLTITYLLKVVSSAVLSSGAIAAAIYQISRTIGM